MALRATAAAAGSGASTGPAGIHRRRRRAGQGVDERHGLGRRRCRRRRRREQVPHGVAQPVQAEGRIERVDRPRRDARPRCWRARARPLSSPRDRIADPHPARACGTNASSAIVPSNSRTIRRSTPWSCTSVSGSNVVITHRGRSCTSSITASPMRRRRPAQARSASPSTPPSSEVRPQAPVIDAERRDGAVGEDRQRQDVEPLEALVPDEFDVLARHRPHRPQRRAGSRHGRPSTSALPSSPSDPCRPSRPGCVRDVTTRPEAWRTWTSRSPGIPAAAARPPRPARRAAT